MVPQNGKSLLFEKIFSKNVEERSVGISIFSQ